MARIAPATARLKGSCGASLGEAGRRFVGDGGIPDYMRAGRGGRKRNAPRGRPPPSLLHLVQMRDARLGGLARINPSSFNFFGRFP